MIICAALVGDAACSSVYLLSVKPPQPVLMVLGSTANSVNVTWNSTYDGDCRLRYRANSTRVWTQVGWFTNRTVCPEASARPWGLGGESSAVTGWCGRLK